MTTTSLFVDLLIIGIQTGVWLTLLFLLLFGIDWIDLSQIKGWEVTIGFLLLPFVYPIGVFVDHGADALLTSWRNRIRYKHLKDESRTVMDLLMTARDDKLSAYYDYLRPRIRISRSSAVNFAMFGVLFPIFAYLRLGGVVGKQTWVVASAVMGASVCIAVLAIYTWQDLTNNFYEKQARGLRLLDQSRAEQPPAPPHHP